MSHEYSIDTVCIDMNDGDRCAICLEEISDEIDVLESHNNDNKNNNHLIKLICCQNYIHEQCLFQVFIAKHKNCSLCRSNMQIIKYFTEQKFIKTLKSFPYRYKNKNYIYINKLLYEISPIKYVFCGLKFKPIKVSILYYLSIHKRIANLIYLMCIYIIIILYFGNYHDDK